MDMTMRSQEHTSIMCVGDDAFENGSTTPIVLECLFAEVAP